MKRSLAILLMGLLALGVLVTGLATERPAPAQSLAKIDSALQEMPADTAFTFQRGTPREPIQPTPPE